MLYGIITNAAGFILSAYAGQGPLPEDYTAIDEVLYLQIAPGASYVNGEIVPATLGAPTPT